MRRLMMIRFYFLLITSVLYVQLSEFFNFLYLVNGYMWQRDGKELADYVKDLKDCTTKWHEKKMSYLLEEDRLRSLLDLFKTVY